MRTHSHQRWCFGPANEIAAGAPAIGRLATLFQNGPSPIKRQGPVDMQAHMGKLFGADTLYRMTPNLGQMPDHLSAGFFR
jgi:hypothetical protein